MLVKVHRNETSNPIEYGTATDAYTKGNLYCVMFTTPAGERKVHKYPLCSIFRIEEDAGKSGRE